MLMIPGQAPIENRPHETRRIHYSNDRTALTLTQPFAIVSNRIIKWLSFTLLLYIGLSSVFGIKGFWEALSDISIELWFIALAACLISHLVLERRWEFYLKQLGFPLPFKSAVKIYTAGLALIAAPGRSGEAVRGLWLQRRHGFPLTVGVGITLAERLADLASALLVLSWGLGEQVLSLIHI